MPSASTAVAVLGVVEPGVLPDRQGVHVGAQQDGGSVAVLQDADHPSPTHSTVDLVPGLFEARGCQFRRAGLLMGELGMGVDVSVEILLPRPGRFDTGQDLRQRRHDGPYRTIDMKHRHGRAAEWTPSSGP